MAYKSPEDDEVSILETIREVSPSHFLLKVESFSLLLQYGIHRYETGEFNAGGYKWKLVLCSNEDKSGKHKNYISVYLAISDTTSLQTTEVNAFFSIFLLNQNLGNYNYSPGRTRCFTAVKSEWGILQFISKEVLSDPSNGFLINDNCVFGVEVFIVGRKKTDFPSFRKRLFGFMGVKDCFTLKFQANDEYEYCNETVVQEDTILETRKASPTHFQMKIKLFSLLGKQRIHNYQRGKFDAGGYKWRLTICTNEEKTGPESKYISVYLAISDTNSMQPANWEVDAVFSIFLFNQISGKYHHSLGRTRRFLAMKSEWGISDFISKKALMDPSNGFLINNNSCVFGAEVFIIQNLAVSECLSMKSAAIPYTRDWKISNLFELGHKWTSNRFQVEGVNWYIVVYPGGYDHEKGCSQSIGVFLKLIDSKRVKTCFSICIKDQLNNRHIQNTIDSRWFSPTSPAWGWNRFVEVSTLKNRRNGFIINDTCHLEIEISVQAIV